jgi:hypothetical protein
VRLNGVGGCQLHDHLPALPGRRGRLCERPASIGDYFDRRRVPVNR